MVRMAFGRYWVPGPVEVHPDVLAAQARPMVAHRSPEVADLFARIQPGLQAVFGTKRTVCVLTASGTGALEAGLRAVPRGNVLSLVNGAFSERSAKIAEAIGHRVERLDVPWGAVHDPASVEARVRAGGYAAITVAHCETSTGALQPITDHARAAGDTPLLVDSVSAAGGGPVEMDRLGLAYACTGSQKALALPPGLAFAVVSDRLLDLARRAPDRGLYLDLARYEANQPPFTPAVSLLYALERQLERVAAEGLEARFERHRAMAERTWAWAEERGVLGVLAPPGHRSPTVTCLRLPRGTSGPAFVDRVAERGYTVGAGYGKLKRTTFRIGHMGEQTPETLEGLLEACGAAIAVD